MEHFSEELKKTKILLKEDLIGLRFYIKNKYPHYDQRHQAIILANSIRDIINQYIDHFPPSHRQNLLNKIIAGSLISKGDGLFLIDVFDTALSFEVEEDFLNHLCTWVNNHITTPIELQDLVDYRDSRPTTKESVVVPIELTENKVKLNPPPVEFNGEPEKISQTVSIIEDLKAGILRLLAIIKSFILHINTSSFISHLSDIKSKTIKAFISQSLPKVKPTYIGLSIITIIFLVMIFPTRVKTKEASIIFLDLPISYEYPTFPAIFHYREIDEDRLKAYLKGRNSILEEEPYFSSIIETAEEFQLNPLVLFAIAGHEQGFVPKDHPRAKEIANNPFNVFHSWQHYNTDIVDSSRIAARTVINLSRDKPIGKDPFQWINRRYAEDQSWYVGVRAIYNRLEAEIEESLP